MDEVLQNFDTDVDGLNKQEVVRRRELHGSNKLHEPEKTHPFFRFLDQFNDPLNYLLIGAAIISTLLHPDQPGDAIFIGIALTANAIFGFWQENQAEQAMDSLKKMAVSTCVVIREGIDWSISTEELVPGDIVRLEEGLNVPADLRFIQSSQCKVDESSLTGESDSIYRGMYD